MNGTVKKPVYSGGQPIPKDGVGIKSTIEVSRDLLKQHNLETLEHINVKVWISHGKRGDVEVELISPNGVRSILAGTRSGDTATTGFPGWTFMTIKHWSVHTDLVFLPYLLIPAVGVSYPGVLGPFVYQTSRTLKKRARSWDGTFISGAPVLIPTRHLCSKFRQMTPSSLPMTICPTSSLLQQQHGFTVSPLRTCQTTMDMLQERTPKLLSLVPPTQQVLHKHPMLQAGLPAWRRWWQTRNGLLVLLAPR